MDIEGLLSNSAWAVLGQLARGNVWDGALISKSGRTELIQKGYARRERKDAQGLMINELTAAGRDIAMHYCSEEGHA